MFTLVIEDTLIGYPIQILNTISVHHIINKITFVLLFTILKRSTFTMPKTILILTVIDQLIRIEHLPHTKRLETLTQLTLILMLVETNFGVIEVVRVLVRVRVLLVLDGVLYYRHLMTNSLGGKY